MPAAAAISLLVQDANPPQGWLSGLAEEPALLELLVVGFLGAVFWLLVWRLGRLAAAARSRAALQDYLLGVEQALSGDLAGARKRLARVLQEAPENQPARLLQAEVLAQLGEPAQAHKLHLELKRAFKMAGPRNELSMARSLLSAGHPKEALAPAETAQRALPDSVEASRVLYRACMALGTPVEAGRIGARLSRQLPPGLERDLIRQAAAAALARAGEVQLLAESPEKARALAAEARAVLQSSGEARLLEARIALGAGGVEAMTALLLGEGREAKAAPASTLVPVAVIGSGPSGLQVRDAQLRSLLPAQPYRCRECLGPAPGPSASCPHCLTEGTIQEVEAQLQVELESPSVVMDEVEENPAHVRRLLDRLQSGDREALGCLVELGESAVEEILALGMRHGPARSAVVEVLRDMGARILPALFAAYGRLRERRILGIVGLGPRRSPVEIVRLVVQGFGLEAKVYFEGLLETEDRDLRKIIVDYFLSLADQEEFRKVLDRYPPVEVIHRLNEADAELLEPLLRGLERGSFLGEGLLLSPTFHRDLDLLEAMGEAADPSVLEQILARRGYNRDIAEALIHALEKPKLSAAASRLLDGFGMETMAHLIAEFADLDQPAVVREKLAEKIEGAGPRVVDRICDCFGPSPSNLDQGLVGLLLGIGRLALGPLAEAYQRGSLLEKLGGSLVRRYSHRRCMILEAMQGIGGGEAVRQLDRLLAQETDEDLRLLLGEALRQLTETGRSVDGEAGDVGEAGEAGEAGDARAAEEDHDQVG